MDVLITGGTGMVGKSVLQQCIKDNRVKNIYLINRIPVNLKSPKISEFLITCVTAKILIKPEFLRVN